MSLKLEHNVSLKQQNEAHFQSLLKEKGKHNLQPDQCQDLLISHSQQNRRNEKIANGLRG